MIFIVESDVLFAVNVPPVGVIVVQFFWIVKLQFPGSGIAAIASSTYFLVVA